MSFSLSTDTVDKGTPNLSLDILFAVIQSVCIIVLERFIRHRRRRRLLYHEPAHC